MADTNKKLDKAGVTYLWKRVDEIKSDRSDFNVLEGRVSVLETNEPDSLITLLNGTKSMYRKVMKQWFKVKGVADVGSAADLTQLVNEWYTVTRDNWCGWTRFEQPEVTAVSTGTRGGDNAGMQCTPSTDTEENIDDFQGLPLFAIVDCNFIMQDNEPLITAIDGIPSGLGTFTRTDPTVYVGVLQMTGYHWVEEEETYYVHGYASQMQANKTGCEPLPEAVRTDGTVRPWVLHAKYLSKTVDNKLTSYAGVIPTGYNISHNTLQTRSNSNGDGISGGCIVDKAFLELMAIIKYASLAMDGVLQGCCSNNYQYPALVGESDVKRIIVAKSNSLEVGMGVIIGTCNTSASSPIDRGTASMYSVTGQAGAIITAIESYTTGGVDYVAVTVDTDSTFTTVANGANQNGTTYISTYAWPTGTNDGILGNDGSIKNAKNGKYPATIQGIEYATGQWEVYADVILKLYQDTTDTSVYYYEPYVVRDKSKQSTDITANYEATGLKYVQPATSSWRYPKKKGYAKGMFFPTVDGISSSQYLKDGFYANGATVGVRELLAFGYLGYGSAVTGLSCVFGTYGLGNAYWLIAARLSPNGFRGEFVA